MPIAEWESLTSLQMPGGTLALNSNQSEGAFVTLREGADSGTDVRATSAPAPQAAGAIRNRGFPDGYGLRLVIQYWKQIAEPGTPASTATTPTAQSMDDTLARLLRSGLDGGGRLFYHPVGHDVRILDDLWTISKPALVEGDGVSTVTVELASPFPYLIDFTQTLTQLSAGSPTATLTNVGSSPYDPVFKVYGPFDDFVLSNLTTGLEIAYDDTLPGAVAVGSGDYIEITTFRNTVYLNGNGASRKAGIDIVNSDFFALEVGANDLQISSGGTAPNVDVLWQSAWW